MTNLYIGAGRRIRQLRENLNMSREALAEQADVSAKFIYEIEKGNKGFSAATLYKLSKCLNVSSDYILEGNSFVDNQEDISHILGLFNHEQICKVCELLKGIKELSIK